MLKALAILSLPALLAATLTFGASRLVGEPPPNQWVVWGGTAFSSPAPFAAWLRARGRSYREWAHAHPAAAARLEGRDTPQEKAAARRPRVAAATTAKAEKAAQERLASRRTSPVPGNGEASARPAAEQGRASGGPDLLFVTLFAAAVAIVALAALPISLLEAMRAPNLVYEHRVELAAAGVSVALGIGTAQLLT